MKERDTGNGESFIFLSLLTSTTSVDKRREFSSVSLLDVRTCQLAGLTPFNGVYAFVWHFFPTSIDQTSQGQEERKELGHPTGLSIAESQLRPTEERECFR